MMLPVRTGQRQRRQLRQGAALVLLALWTVAQLGGQLHRLEQPHAVCAEHGEQVHAPGPGVAAGPVARAAEPGAELSGSPPIPGSQADGHHDHCSIGAPLSPEPPAVTVAFGQPGHALAAATTAPVGVELSGPAVFVIAPKTSPPSA
jgi:hypothetical protein